MGNYLDGQVKDVVKKLSALSERVEDFETNLAIKTTNSESKAPEEDYLLGAIRRREDEQRRGRLAHISYKDTLKKEVNGVCSCGEHVGIDFIAPDGTIVEHGVCPKHWWIDQCYLAFTKGKLGEFTTNNPLGKYLEFGVKKRGRKK